MKQKGGSLVASLLLLFLILLLLSYFGSIKTKSTTTKQEGYNLKRRNENDNSNDTVIDDTTTTTTTNEELYLQIPSSQKAKSNLYFITRYPHIAGTDGDRLMASFVRQEFQTMGIPNVTIFDLVVLLNYPRTAPTLELVERIMLSVDTTMRTEDETRRRIRRTTTDNNTNTKNDTIEKKHHSHKLIYQATLSEDILDPAIDDTTDTYWRNHTFHGYSPSGSVEGAHVIYANYGRPQDFDILEQAGISVKDHVVIVRYGKCFRGLKVKNAQLRGAIAVIIYSDPADDGYGIGQVYPNGPWRPSSGVQRGSVQWSSQCAGDPLRADPRYQSVVNTTVQQLCGVDSIHQLIPSIPSLPISYRDALPILENLGGPVAADIPGGLDFVGGLSNLTYHIGPSRGLVNLQVDNENAVRKIPNVIGVIPGTLPKEQDMPVLLGNHRDAWVYGAADPNSGTATLLEVARGLGRLYSEHNWRPLRTIYLLSWSGEEYGLLGSTGWSELNQPLIDRAAAYLNTDTVVSGDHLKVSASPSLISLWKSVMNDLNETKTNETTNSISFANAPYGEIRDANTDWQIDADTGVNISVLGSGSDYTAFLDHFGIPSLDFQFSKQGAQYGQYHSIYDSFAWMDKYGGHDNVTGSAFDLMELSAKIWGLLALRLATTEIIPLDHIVQGQALTKYTSHIEEQIKSKADINLQNLTKAVEEYKQAAAKLQLQCSSAGDLLDSDDVLMCNERLGLVERNFLLKDGLPGRPWFKHCLQAPGIDLGYAAEAFPGIQQAIDVRNYTQVQLQIILTTERIQQAAEYMSGNITA